MRGEITRTDMLATALFDKDWKPGFYKNGSRIVAVKCLHVLFAEEDGSEVRKNTCDLAKSVVCCFRDSDPNTLQMFEHTRRSEDPVRVAIKMPEKGGYVDMGWAVARGVVHGKLAFYFGDDVQVRFSDAPYPVYLQANGAPPEAVSQRTSYDGYVFDSKLEARHAAFFRELGFRVEPQKEFATVHGQWAIDFLIRDETTDRKYYVEIKPTYPFLQEMQRCASVAHHVRPTPVVLLYGDFSLPWKEEPSQYSRLPAAGVVGMMWHFSGSALAKREVVWKLDEAGFAVLGEVSDPSNDFTWRVPRLAEAYEAARRAVP